MNKKTNILASIFSTTIFILTPTLTSAEVFCIGNQSDFENAFNIAKSNGENDTLRIVQGSMLNDFKLPKEIGYLIKLESGYSFDCTERQILPKISLKTEKTETIKNQKDVMPQHSTTGPVAPPEVRAKTDTLSADIASGGSDVTVLGVPGYEWRHGCGPTAVGMVLGYWDAKGYDDLFEGSAQTQTEAVNQGIASSGHYDDYSSPEDEYPNMIPDKSELGGAHTSDSIADFMYTSWSSEDNYYGWSWSNHITPAFSNYAQLRNNSYVALTAEYRYNSTLSWDVLTNEIDANRPMVFLVDSSGDGYTDHLITVVGYRIQDGYQYYGCLDTWYPYDTVRWERFRGMSSSYAWGIWGGFSFELLGAVIDEKINIVPAISSLLLF